MIQAPDDTVLKRLALVRQFYVQAVAQMDGPASLLRRITSVISLDLAVENALRVTIAALDPSFKVDTDATYPKVVQHASDLLQDHAGATLPAKSGIGYLHHIRNDAQHNGRYPSTDEIAECRIHASSFLTELCSLVWDLDFARISVTSLIRDQDAKALLEEAEAALASGQHPESVTKAAAGLSWLMSEAAAHLFPRSKTRLWRGIGPIRWNIGLGTPPKPKVDADTAKELARIEKDLEEKERGLRHELRGLREEIKDELDAMEEPVLCSLLGLSYSAYQKFRAIAGTQHFNAGPRDFTIRNALESPSEENARFVVAFCIEASLQVESSAPPAASSP